MSSKYKNCIEYDKRDYHINDKEDTVCSDNEECILYEDSDDYILDDLSYEIYFDLKDEVENMALPIFDRNFYIDKVKDFLTYFIENE